MVVHTFDHSAQEAEQAGLWVQGQPSLQMEFQDSQGYTEKPCVGEKTKQYKTLTNKQNGK